jgi:endoglucanase
VNWFGLETPIFAPHGLWTRNWEDMLDQIVTTGFNAIRLPFSNEVLQPASLPTSIDFGKNADLKGLNGLQVMDRIVEGARRRGLVVVLDRHRPTADAQSELWYTDRVSERRWLDDWTMLASHYRSQPAVIGADLHNEPHGQATWGDGNPRTDWRLAAQRAGNAILEVNPDWLIIVQGIERFGGDSYWWGGNLEGARDHPIQLSRPDKLVYSAHDYGPGVYPQAWFQAPDFPQNLPSIWQRHWAWLHSEQIAPVLLGEFGGRSVGQDREGIWQRRLVDFLKASGLSYTYWAWNPDSGDTGGILKDDWTTIDRDKLDLLATYQRPKLKTAVNHSPQQHAA